MISKPLLLAIPIVSVAAFLFLYTPPIKEEVLLKPQIEGIETKQEEPTSSVIITEIPTSTPILTIQVYPTLTQIPSPTKNIVLASSTPIPLTPTPSKRSWTGTVVLVYLNTEPKVMFVDEYWQLVKDFISTGKEIRVTNSSNNKTATLKVLSDQPFKEFCKTLIRTYDPCSTDGGNTPLTLASHLVRFDQIEKVVDFKTDFNPGEKNYVITDLSFQEI